MLNPKQSRRATVVIWFLGVKRWLSYFLWHSLPSSCHSHSAITIFFFFGWDFCCFHSSGNDKYTNWWPGLQQFFSTIHGKTQSNTETFKFARENQSNTVYSYRTIWAGNVFPELRILFLFNFHLNWELKPRVLLSWFLGRHLELFLGSSQEASTSKFLTLNVKKIHSFGYILSYTNG